MSKKPKIEFYKINLSPSDADNAEITFRDVLIAKELAERANEESAEPILDGNIMPYLLASFIRDIDGVALRNDSKRKAFYAKNAGEEEANRSVALLSTRNIIHGRIKGGGFDTGKYLDVLTTPGEDTEALDATKLLSDDFYFLLYTPLNKRRGVLILQTYTQDSIADIFRPFVENLFKVRGLSNKATSSLFMPQEMQEQFKRESVVKKFEYKNNYVINPISEEGLSEGQFTVTLSISSHGNQINLANLPRWRRVLGTTLLNIPQTEERTIDTFNNKRGYIKGGLDNSNPTKFELDGSNVEIKATIYLDNFIAVSENGTPNWTELHTFAINTLTDDVIPEIYPEDFIR